MCTVVNVCSEYEKVIHFFGHWVHFKWITWSVSSPDTINTIYDIARKQGHDGQRRRLRIFTVGKIKVHDQNNNVTIILKAQLGDNLEEDGQHSVLHPPPFELTSQS